MLVLPDLSLQDVNLLSPAFPLRLFFRKIVDVNCLADLPFQQSLCLIKQYLLLLILIPHLSHSQLELLKLLIVRGTWTGGWEGITCYGWFVGKLGCLCLDFQSEFGSLSCFGLKHLVRKLQLPILFGKFDDFLIFL